MKKVTRIREKWNNDNPLLQCEWEIATLFDGCALFCVLIPQVLMMRLYDDACGLVQYEHVNELFDSTICWRSSCNTSVMKYHSTCSELMGKRRNVEPTNIAAPQAAQQGILITRFAAPFAAQES